MKNSRNQTSKQSKQGTSRVPKPEIRDDLDSRKHKEQGSDNTHNKKEKKRSERDSS